MPDDKLKRLSNLLTQMQVRDALNTPKESTNVSPQYLQQEIARRDTIKLEKAGNEIDPLTKKPNKYSEQWLQSTGQQVPGLDSEGQSALDALNVTQLPGLAKVVGAIGREGIKRGIGRIATNIIETNAENISSSLKGMNFKSAIKAIIKDKPLYNMKTDEVPYRMMFGLKPRRFKVLDKSPTSTDIAGRYNDIYRKNPDGSLRFVPGSENYHIVKENMMLNRPSREFVMGNYKQTGNRYWDKWDVDLNPGELQRNIKSILDIKDVEGAYNPIQNAITSYNSVPNILPNKIINSVGEIDKFKLATEKTKAILRLLERAAVRKTVNYFSDPVVIQGTIKGVK